MTAPSRGWVYELDIEGQGMAYLQYVCNEEPFGEFCRVLPGIHRPRPDIRDLVQREADYMIAIPLEASVRLGLLRPVGQETVPPGVECPPALRIVGTRLPDGSVPWWIVRDSEGERRVETLRPHEREYTFGSTMTVPLLATRIARGWRPSDEHGQPREGGPLPPVQDDDVSSNLFHFLYFPDPATAQDVANRLQVQHYDVEVHDQGPHGWLVRASSNDPERSVDDDMDQLEVVADQAGGEYDGYEVELGD